MGSSAQMEGLALFWTFRTQDRREYVTTEMKVGEEMCSSELVGVLFWLSMCCTWQVKG